MCLFNSFNFDFPRLRRFARRGARMVHRVDGPIGAYRGFDDGTDARIAEVNAALASATIFQSEFSLAKHRELGFELREPVVIPNAVDPAIFHPPTSRDPLGGQAGAADREQLVGQSAQGRGDARLARPEPRPRPLRAHLRRAAAGRISSASASSGRSSRARSPTCSGRRTSTSLRAATTRARTHCSRRLRAACPPRIATAAGIPSSSARAGSRFGRTRSSVTCSIASSPSSTSAARRSGPRPLASVADSYLEVLGLRVAA